MIDPEGPDFVLDNFQRRAMEHLDAGRSVLVTAPTGSGKTVVADHAVDRALAAGRRAFYTTPIKALSNQKYRDLRHRLGPQRVGLLTGDNVIAGDADVVVMTTEVLRNMLYAEAVDDRLGAAVLDEVHYLEDPYRGPVWEEVILQLPPSVVLVCLSATVSNHEQLGGWLKQVRGPTAVVVESRRPVPLTNLYAVGRRRSDAVKIVPTLLDGRPNPEAGPVRCAPRVPGASRFGRFAAWGASRFGRFAAWEAPWSQRFGPAGAPPALCVAAAAAGRPAGGAGGAEPAAGDLVRVQPQGMRPGRGPPCP